MSVHALDRFLNNVFDVYAMPNFSSDFTYTKDEYHVTADDKQYTIEIAMPGISKSNLKVNIEDNTLTVEAVSTSKSKIARNIKKSWYVEETVDISSITAKLEDGLLTITIPKNKPAKKSVSVTIS